jgi:hypothetical protein
MTGRGDSEALFRRLVLSNADLVEAEESYRRLLALNQFDLRPLEQHPDTGAHLTRLVVSYARPFSRNRGARTTRSLPNRFLDQFTEAERATHTRILDLRHQEFAHSDEDAADVHIAVVPGDPSTVSGIWRRPRVLFDRDEMARVGECIRKLREAIDHELRRLRAELRRVPPAVNTRGAEPR